MNKMFITIAMATTVLSTSVDAGGCYGGCKGSGGAWAPFVAGALIGGVLLQQQQQPPTYVIVPVPMPYPGAMPTPAPGTYIKNWWCSSSGRYYPDVGTCSVSWSYRP